MLTWIIQTVAEKKPGTFGLTVGVFQDPHLKKLVSSAISHTMTQRRSFIKGHVSYHLLHQIP